MATRMIFAGGGTGGHVYPGLSVAAVVRAMQPDAELLYVGTGDAQEARLARAAGLRYTGVRASGIRARSPWRAAQGVGAIALGTVHAAHVLRRFRPRVVFATGGYGSVPVALAAAARRIPLVTFLPDVYPGWAVRTTARLATRIATSTEAALEFLPVSRTEVTGYPIRPAFTEVQRATAREQLQLPPRVAVLLVTGGSSGALALNAAVAHHLPQFTRLAHVLHLTGRRDEARMLRYREKLPARQRERYHVYGYLEDMPSAMAAADLGVTRAGASIFGELPATGLPAVLVPLDLSDQARNARFLASQGAAVMVKNDDAPQELFPVVQSILTEPERLAEMRRAMTALARPDAARDIARLLLEAQR